MAVSLVIVVVTLGNYDTLDTSISVIYIYIYTYIYICVCVCIYIYIYIYIYVLHGFHQADVLFHVIYSLLYK